MIKAKHSNAVVELSHHYDCYTTNIVYIIELDNIKNVVTCTLDKLTSPSEVVL